MRQAPIVAPAAGCDYRSAPGLPFDPGADEVDPCRW